MAQVQSGLPGGCLVWPAQGGGEEGPRNCQPSGHRGQQTGSGGPKVPSSPGQHSLRSKWEATHPTPTQVRADAVPTAHLRVRGVCHSCDKDSGPGRRGGKAAAASIPQEQLCPDAETPPSPEITGIH